MINKTNDIAFLAVILAGALILTPALAIESSAGIIYDNSPSVDCPADNGDGYAYGAWNNNWKCNIPLKFSEVENLTIDSRIIKSTPHWIFLAAGTQEKQALLDYIESASVTENKKDEWTQFIWNIWMEHPVTFDNSTGSPMLVPGNSDDAFALTPMENATFQEIELYIAEDMEKVKNGEVTIQWAPDSHSKLLKIALDGQGYPNNLYLAASTGAQDPDFWAVNSIPGYQQLNHGFVPGLGGLATVNFANYADIARQKFSSHDYTESFTNMGYASHYMADLGNPYHTPMIQIIPLAYVDTPYSQIIFPNSEIILNYLTLHNEYEGMVDDHWDMFYTDNQDRYNIFDPSSSAGSHGTASWLMSYRLVYDCYWHFILTRNYNFENNPAVLAITRNRVMETMKNTRGLVRYVTGGQYPTLTITATAGPGGSISPSGAATVRYGEPQTFTISPNSGYIIDQVLVDGVPTTQNPYQFPMVTSDHTISATFKQNLPAIVPLCQAGTPFDATKYAQNWPQSDPMVFTCNWDGNGQVYLSGDRSSLIGTYADDGFTVDTPKGIQFDAQGHWAHMHPPLELTSGMNPGSNTFTLIVRNWAGLSMSYGSITGAGTDQVPYIIQVNSPTTTVAGENPATDELPSFVTTTENGLIVNGSVIS